MNGNRPVTFASLKYGFRRRQVAGLVNRRRTIPVQSSKYPRDTHRAGTLPSTDERHAGHAGTRRIVPPHPNSPSSPLTGCPPPTCVTVACRPPAIAPIHRRVPACLPSSLAPFVATHPPPVTNRLSDFDSSRRVEPWRVGECSLT